MKRISYILLGAMLIGAVAYLIVSSDRNKFSGSDKPQVAASFYPLYFLASEIVGDKVEVFNITPAGTEPHDHDLRAGDRVQIENSDLLVLIGRNFEPWVDRINEILAGSGTKVLTLAENEPDPHFWLSPSLTKDKVILITQELKSIDPENASVYDQKAGTLLARLDELDDKFKRELESCERRDFITSHDAFGYFARDYRLNQVAISGISPDEEPSARDMVRIAEFARANNVKYIFFESLLSPELAETIATEVGARTLVLNPIEGLTEEEIADGKNYFTEMENNLTNLKIALECK